METTQSCTVCDGQTLRALAEAGKLWLEANHERVNELNVFPVPDGDTGINMLLTMRNAFAEVKNNESHDASEIARRLAHGAIMGSRGNSGTIMSQIWSGFAHGLGGAQAFDVKLAVKALREGATRAYGGVQKPTEGTILTVIREIAEEAEAIQDSTDDLRVLLEKLVTRGWDAVNRTPQMLPILKQAGVVDSGGSGLMYVFEGMLKHLRGEEIKPHLSVDQMFEEAVAKHDRNLAEVLDPGEAGYNYDVQFVIKGKALVVEKIKADIEAMGDSAVIVGDSEIVKVHVHVDNPAIPIDYGVKLGILMDVVVENMQEQYQEYLKEHGAPVAATPPVKLASLLQGQIGVVAVASGQGLAQVFAELGVAGIVEGGQTNNPSTEEIIQTIQALGTDRVVVLPNNKNIIMAAEQAAQLIENVQVKVIPTRTFPQGVAAMLPYRPDDELAVVADDMDSAKNNVITVEVTVATRTVEIDGVAVTEGQAIALIDGKLKMAGDQVDEVVQAALKEVDLSAYEIVTLYYGEDVQRDQAENLLDSLRDTYDDLAFEAVPGGQPHYHYIIGIE